MKMVSLVWKFVCYNEIMVIEVRYVIINTQCSAKRTNWEVQTPYEAKVTSPSKRGKLTIGKNKSSILLWTSVCLNYIEKWTYVFLSSFLFFLLIFVFPLVLLCTANLYSIMWFILSLYAMLQISKEMRLNSCT